MQVVSNPNRVKFVHVTYAAVRDEAGEFQRCLGISSRISNLIRRIDSEFIRKLE